MAGWVLPSLSPLIYNYQTSITEKEKESLCPSIRTPKKSICVSWKSGGQGPERWGAGHWWQRRCWPGQQQARTFLEKRWRVKAVSGDLWRPWVLQLKGPVALPEERSQWLGKKKGSRQTRRTEGKCLPTVCPRRQEDHPGKSGTPPLEDPPSRSWAHPKPQVLRPHLPGLCHHPLSFFLMPLLPNFAASQLQ